MDEKTAYALLNHIQDEGVRFVDLRFADILGADRHFTIPSDQVSLSLLMHGKGLDGSSLPGWLPIEGSDLALEPIQDQAFIDPFFQDRTLVLRCNVFEPKTGARYDLDPRNIAEKAEAYAATLGIAEQVLFGPEVEFFIFDAVSFSTNMNHSFYKLESREGFWENAAPASGFYSGYRPKIKEGYIPVPPIDSAQNLRSQMVRCLEDIRIPIEVHHHEVATACQNEIVLSAGGLCETADRLINTKYVIRNVAHAMGKTATFLPKPLKGDNGSGMHVHQSLIKDGKNSFFAETETGLSDDARYYIGGIIKHAHALNALTNSTTNSYRRLLPGYEAPTLLVYGLQNRSAAIRVPHSTPNKRRIELRFPDPCANPYLAFSAMLMAGLDGIKNRIDPGPPYNKNAFESDTKDLPSLATSLNEAMDALERDHQFLLEGGVFTKDFIRTWVELKRKEIFQLAEATHPVEWEMYYAL